MCSCECVSHRAGNERWAGIGVKGKSGASEERSTGCGNAVQGICSAHFQNPAGEGDVGQPESRYRTRNTRRQVQIIHIHCLFLRQRLFFSLPNLDSLDRFQITNHKWQMFWICFDWLGLIQQPIVYKFILLFFNIYYK